MFGTIRNQLILAGAIAAAFIALLAVSGLYAVQQLQLSLEDTTRSALAIRNHLVADMMHDAMRADVFAGQIAAKAGNLAQVSDAAKDNDEHYKELLDKMHANQQANLSSEIDATLRGVLPVLQRYGVLATGLLKEFGTNPAGAERKVPEFLDLFTELERSMVTAREKIEARVRETEQHAQEQTRNSFRLVTSSAALALGLSLVFGVLLFRRITRPLGALRSVVERVNAGDMQARAHLTTRDELGAFSNAFDKLLDERIASLDKAAKENETLNTSVLGLLQAVSQMARKDLTVRATVTEDVTGPVADALNLANAETAKVLRQVSDISADVSQASLLVKQQSDAVQAVADAERVQVDATAESLLSTSQAMGRIAELAQTCNAAADRAIKTTQSALTSVNSTVGGIVSTRDTIRETEKRIKRLGERSQEISVAVNLINTIAERTHILALNAAMHAASAGEAGRGFAVVADEVQRLAESARQATQQIAALVGNIQVETADTVNTMNTAITQVVEGSKIAEQAGQQMQATQETTSELVAAVQRIAAQSQEQAAMSKQLIERAVQSKESSIKTKTELVAQAEQTGRLVEYAKSLLSAVRVFKLSATTS
jgi:methyl-accepting chemotaxis protein